MRRTPWNTAILHARGREVEGQGGSPHARGDLARDEVPDVVRPALEDAGTRHDVQTVACGMRVGAEQRGPINRQEVDVGVFVSRKDFLLATPPLVHPVKHLHAPERTSNSWLKSPIWFQLYQPHRPGVYSFSGAR